jgi:superfamily II DNA or RNA helicase
VGQRAWESGAVKLVEHDEPVGAFLLAVLLGVNRFEVHLWPDDAEWECECEAAACAHAFASLLALEQGVESLEEAGDPPRLVADLTTEGGRLSLRLSILEEGESRPFAGAVPPGLRIPDELKRLLGLARDWNGGRVPTRQHRMLLSALRSLDDVRLDGESITVSRVPLDGVIRVRPTGAGYLLSLGDAEEVTRSWAGEPAMVLAEGVLRPRGFGKLSAAQQNRLAQPILFGEHELPRLTSEWIPSLKRVITVIEEEGVPQAGPGGLQTILELRQVPGALEICARIVYGDPPVAEVIGDHIVALGGIQSVPPRDRRAEREALAVIQDRLAMRAGQRLRLEGERAIRFVQDRLPGFSGRIVGEDVAENFRLRGPALQPRLRWGRRLELGFGSGKSAVGAEQVLAAWRRGERVISLASGGFAALPTEWLDEHGGSMELLLGAAQAGRPPIHLAPLAAELGAEVDDRASFDPRGLLAALRGDEPLPAAIPPEGLADVLRDYQLEGFRWLQLLGDHKLGAVLADDMGLGKTIQTLAALAADGNAGPKLVVAPTSVLSNWEREAARFVPGLRCAVLHGPNRDARLAQLRAGELDVLITSYGILRRDMAELAEVDWKCLVLDEAQAIKNADSQTAKAAKGLRAERRIALTGTPIENHLGELWSLMDFVNPGFFGPQKRFTEQLGDPARDGDPVALEALRRRVAPFVLRRLKADVAPELPPRTETVLRCPMSEAQTRGYKAVQEAAKRGLPSEHGPRRMQILAALTKLRQAACDAALLGERGGPSSSGKLDRLDQMLEPIVDEGHRVLVFSQWTSLLDLVEPRLVELGISWLRLDGSTRNRQALVDRFQEPEGPPVFLLSLKAGGTGLNLTAADHVIHLDPWWNPAAEQQASDRAHRIGQTKPVFIWKLVSEGTVEEAILDLQDSKRALADAVLEGQSAGTKLSVDDLADLIG